MRNNERPILVVEDSEADFYLFKTASEEAGITNPLVRAASYEDAVGCLTGHGKGREELLAPAVVFLDLNMPIATGFDLLKWIRSEGPVRGLVIIMLSGSSLPEDISRAYSLGANSYLVKPKTHEGLVKMLKDFRSYWLGFNRLP